MSIDYVVIRQLITFFVEIVQDIPNTQTAFASKR